MKTLFASILALALTITAGTAQADGQTAAPAPAATEQAPSQAEIDQAVKAAADARTRAEIDNRQTNVTPLCAANDATCASDAAKTKEQKMAEDRQDAVRLETVIRNP